MKVKLIAMLISCCMHSHANALEAFKTNIKLSTSEGDMYCQNIVHNNKADWRMPSFPDFLELLSKGFEFETTYCSNTIGLASLGYLKCMTSSGAVTNDSPTRAYNLMCIRGESGFSQTPEIAGCPAAAFSMSEGILHIPLVNVPDMLGNITIYDVHLEMISDDVTFQLLRATKIN